MLQVKPFSIRRFLPLPYEEALEPRLRRAHRRLQSAGGWVRPRWDGAALDAVLADAASIRREARVLIVVGSGGAFLGARGVIRCLCGPSRETEGPMVRFVGGASADGVGEALALTGDLDFSVAVSGGDAETGGVLRVFRRALAEKYGREEAERRLYRVPPLETAGSAEPYGLLTAPGLLPMAAAGVDIASLTAGAAEMAAGCAAGGYDCAAWQYASLRYELYRTGRPVEVLVCREAAYRPLLEWWRLVFSGDRGILPAAGFAEVLPLAGQAPRWERRPLFETILCPAPAHMPEKVPAGDFGDGMDFLAGESLDDIARRALESALLTHTDSGVPCVVLESGGTAAELGELIYFFSYVSALCRGLLEGETAEPSEGAAYQRNLSALLGQPGYSRHRAALEQRLWAAGGALSAACLNGDAGSGREPAEICL